MNKLRFKTFAVLAVMMATVCLMSCDKDDPKPNPDEGQHHFLFLQYLDNSAAYIGTFSDLSQKNVDNKNAYEFGFGCYPFSYKNIVLLAEGVWGDKIHKFVRGSDGHISPAGTMTFAQGAKPGEITFVDEHLAYVSINGRGTIAMIDPTEMKQLGEIDLSAYAVGDNNPDPGCNVLRDGKLYVALNQSNSTHSSVPGVGAEVAIIDLGTKKVEKVIKDSRTRPVGMFRHSCAFTDEKGDIYFYSAGMDGVNPLKDGFLRIKKGETEWDKDYHFKLSTTSIKGIPDDNAVSLVPYLYDKNGNIYACIQLQSKTSNPPDFVNDKNFQPVKINVWNKTIEKIELPLTTSMGSFAYAKYGDLIVFGMTCANGTGYYTYNKKTGVCSSSPVTTTVGVPASLISFE